MLPVVFVCVTAVNTTLNILVDGLSCWWSELNLRRGDIAFALSHHLERRLVTESALSVESPI